MCKSSFFGVINCQLHENLIRITKGYKQKIAFILPLGLQEYIVILFGLINILAIYQRQNNKILRLYNSFAIYYLDNILIYSEKEEDYKGYVLRVLEALRKVDSRLKLTKYEFGVRKVTFLGYIIELRRILINVTLKLIEARRFFIEFSQYILEGEKEKNSYLLVSNKNKNLERELAFVYRLQLIIA